MSKEKIEKAKERIQKSLNDILFKTLYSQEENDEDEKILLQYIKELEADNYECNNIVNDYIEERHKLIDIMKADRMEQLDDYVIYLINKYLKELGALEDE